MSESPIVVSVPDHAMLGRLAPVDGARFTVWDFESHAPERIDLAVIPYMSPVSLLGVLSSSPVTHLQSQSIGYDGVAELLPVGVTFANAAGVHEDSTAELALALILASLRGIPDFVVAQAERRWVHDQYESLADKRVLVIGNGGIGKATVARLLPFEVDVTRVATTARADDRGTIHGFDELPELLPHADVIVLAVPLTPTTTHLVDERFLQRLRRGALVVNVSRGAVIETDALLRHLHDGRVRAALDVTDPEPLPAGHPLWSAPGVLISPHVGGHSGAMAPRIDRLVRAQAARLVAGEPLTNVVLPADRP